MLVDDGNAVEVFFIYVPNCLWATLCNVIRDGGGLGEYPAEGGEVERVWRGAGRLMQFANTDIEALCIQYDGSGRGGGGRFLAADRALLKYRL